LDLWAGQVVNSDQGSKATISAFDASGEAVVVRGSTSAKTYYDYAALSSGTPCTLIAKNVAGTVTTLASTNTCYSTNDTIELRMIGSTLIPLHNGKVDTNLLCSSVFCTDSSITSGYPGILMVGTGDSFKNFCGGSLPLNCGSSVGTSIYGTAQYYASPIIASQLVGMGAICTNAELALSSGWQVTGTATVTAVQGTGQTCSWTITTGTTVSASPTVTDTLTNPLPSALTVCEIIINGGTHTGVAGESFHQTTLSATAPIFTFNGTPGASGVTYFITRRCGP
jgi:hypothetical protein